LIDGKNPVIGKEKTDSSKKRIEELKNLY